ncbi:MAG: cytochrome c3 family protein [Deltaproteobacteria bacterium]
MKARIILLLLLALCVVVAAQPAQPEELDWSPVVYPLQRLPLIFSHQKHLARGTTCVACHPNATSSQSAVDNLIPTEAQCRACHAIDRADPAKQATPTAACGACHPNWTAGSVVQQVYLTPPPLKFAHAQHASTTCETCHPVRNVDLATTKQLPTMASCITCHKDGEEERHCTDCHLAKLGGLVETQFEHGRLVPGRDGLGDQHGPGFTNNHTQEARQAGNTCNACHDKSECVECHQGVVKPADFHPGNYLALHVIDAKRGKDCSACHRSESFCVACHERSGVGTRAASKFNEIDPSTRFHPIGWASPNAGPNLHAQEARRNITTCASCHREEDCLTCHSAQPGAAHASPHPIGWRGSSRCRALDRGNRRMCLRCHITQDELGCDWSKH